MIKSIIFDFDGVILNSNNIKAEAFGELYNKYGKKIENKVVEYHYENLGISRIEKIKYLLNAEKQPNNLYQTFKKFKEEWHNIGQVPITERNNIWETYRHNVNKFYDFLHLNRELRELDFKHNYDEKIKIIKKPHMLKKLIPK